MGNMRRLEPQRDLPLVDPAPPHLARLHVHITPEQKTWIERQKKVRKMSESAIIRELIDDAMKARR